MAGFASRDFRGREVCARPVNSTVGRLTLPMNRRQIIGVIAGTAALVAAAAASVISLPGALLSLRRRVLPAPVFEPSSLVHLGRPADFPMGVDTRFLQS